MTWSVPDEGYSNSLTWSVPDEGYSNSLTWSVPDEGYSNSLTLSISDEGYSRNVSCILKSIDFGTVPTACYLKLDVSERHECPRCEY